ncbi:uroporphyrinogen decarboxylase family protein [Moorella sulfitireducens]|uniref:uroporphyrinogen decarboxylase family protein n=1 Tax=Neomoorella sulfitireducens TaxID=2972948 RepID=UPI0021AC805B|nr:uroporphyrinogen decarboxylase family protein [Moorella sulfitireducens]
MKPEERQEQMFLSWLSGKGIEFANPQAEKDYKERVMRLKEAIQLKGPPDRVPVCPLTGLFPVYYSGITVEEAMYDYDKAADAWKKYVLDFKPDAYVGTVFVPPGRFFEVLDYKIYRWPGHGVPPDISYQFLEAEYMKADEYDTLIQDPSDFWLRSYFPRIFGVLKPFAKLAPFTEVLEMVMTCGSFIPFGLPEVQAAFKALFAAGEEACRWAATGRAVDRALQGRGFPALVGGISKAPFDIIGDTLRGTRGIITDMYRRPEKLLQALEAVVPLAIRMGVSSAGAAGHPLVFMPLHKGADGFLSGKQFATFYWPTLRKVIIGLIEEGMVPFLFAEGSYNSRLEIIRNLPRGRTVWLFDQTDMAEAKEILGDIACIAGNVPITLLTLGTADEVKEYCRRLLKTAGKDGGFILSSGVAIDNIRPENMRALIETAKESGNYF